jgi:pyruvate dehydrogenase E1 component alpha subunit
MDVLKMRQVMKDAVDRAREDKIPTLVEARCYRFMGHSMSDPVHGVYRTKEEVEEHKEKDPIRRFIEDLEDAGMLTDDELKAMDEEIKHVVDDAAKFAEESPDPAEDALYDDVYSELNPHGRLFFDRRRD